MRIVSTTNTRKGATSIEFALVLPLVFLFVLGLVEWGRFEMVRQVTSTAAFNGARLGTIPGSTVGDVEDRVDGLLEMYFVRGATTTTFLTEDDASVHVAVPMSENSFMLGTFFGNVTLEREFCLKAD